MTTIPGRGGLALPTHPTHDRSGHRSRRHAEPASWRTGALPWALAACAGVLIIDMFTSTGFAVGALYAFPILIASMTASRRLIICVAAVSSLLVLFGWMVSPVGAAREVSIVNRSVSLLVVWAIALMALRLTTTKSAFSRSVDQEHAAAVELHEAMRLGLTRLLTLSDQIARSGATAAQAAQRIRSRAQVMLTVLGVLSRSRGSPVELEALVRSMLPGSSADVLRMSGPSITIPARQTQAIVLLLHELLSNCRSHGVLSGNAGRIDINWTVDPLDGEPAQRVTLCWEETGGRPIEREPSPGFGTALISNAVVHDLSGSVEMSYPPDGCKHQFQFIVDDHAPLRGR
jgi:two-component sensor histidine kinase